MSMTNEQLAELIAEGGNDELLPLLWEKMRKLYKMWGAQFYNSHTNTCESAGVVLDDIISESYIAMTNAIKAYACRSEESKDTLFTSFCRFPFKNHVASLVGIRTERQRKEPLKYSSSIDVPLTSDSGEDVGTLGDIIPDPSAAEMFEQAENNIYNQQIHNIVEREMNSLLDERQINIIRRYYWNKQTLLHIANDYGLNLSRIRQIRDKALRTLGRSKSLRQFAEINYYQPCSVSSCACYGSTVERIAEMKESLLNQIVAKSL